MLQGDLVDLDTRRNLTDRVRQSVRAEVVGELGEEGMIVFAPDTVKHTVTVFTDVDCPYCVKLHRQMADYNELGHQDPVYRVPAGRDPVAYLRQDGIGVVRIGSAYRDRRCEDGADRSRRAAVTIRYTSTTRSAARSG